jgi:ABC-type transport system substrate-binding protein
LRFALVGQPTDANVWAFFDEMGASYANYTIHSDEYPRLYRLSIPAREFELFVAQGLPSAVTREGSRRYASVALRPDLQWSDGSRVTAQDVAFTVNTVLAFRLGLDWLSAYNSAVLDHAEAVDDVTIRFYFKAPFNVGDWQYGALQGPILSQAYWSPKVGAPMSLLPSDELFASLGQEKANAVELQARVDADNAQLLTSASNPQAVSELTARIKHNQDNLNSVNSQVEKLQDEYDAALNAARAALHALDDEGEPTFGPFLRAAQSGNVFTREVNPAYPFEQPNYDRVEYTIFEDLISAYEDYQAGRADVVLSSHGAGPESTAPSYPTSGARFLVFNPKRNSLADPALHRALSCVIDSQAMLSGQEWAYDGFVLPGPWLKDEPLSICSNLSNEQKIEKSASLLKEAGYSWTQEPTVGQAGVGLILPDGNPFPAIKLLTVSAEQDLWRANSAAYIETQAKYLGIPLTRQEASLEAIRYAVYSSGDYDMAILGWKLSEYPGYLCDWFQAPSPFAYDGDDLKSVCEAFNSTADLGTARQASHEIQSILMEDLPFIPLYLHMEFENHLNVTYPFDFALNGLSGLYGAPSQAIPLP